MSERIYNGSWKCPSCQAFVQVTVDRLTRQARADFSTSCQTKDECVDKAMRGCGFEPAEGIAPRWQEETGIKGPVEREWTDEFGTHYEVRAQAADGRIFSRKFTRNGPLGYPRERYTAYEAIKALAETSKPGMSQAEAEARCRVIDSEP